MRCGALALVLLALVACERSADPVARGRRVYAANCTACHHVDPLRQGTLGPAVAGSSRALLEARVLHASYPDGYTPKHDTRLMAPLPYLGNDIDDLTAYLASAP